MASTYSDSYKLELMPTGANANTWGTNTNNNLSVIDKMSAGYISKSVAGSANVTLTTANADPATESANKVIELTGTLTGNIHVFLPAVENYYIIFNNTAGSHTLDIAVTGHGANSVTVTQGAHTILYSKGDAVVDLFANSLGNLSIKNNFTVSSTVMTASNGNINAAAYSGDGSNLTGVSSIPSGSTALFYQSSAPSGWTQNTAASINTTAMRVVTGTGGGTGGSDAFGTTFGSSKTTAPGTINFTDTSGASVPSNFSVGATTLSTPTIPSHTHTAPQSPFSPGRFGGVQCEAVPPLRASGNTGGGGSHTHPFSGSLELGGSGSCTTSLSVPAMNLKFANVIACSKD